MKSGIRGKLFEALCAVGLIAWILRKYRAFQVISRICCVAIALYTLYVAIRIFADRDAERGMKLACFLIIAAMEYIMIIAIIRI